MEDCVTLFFTLLAKMFSSMWFLSESVEISMGVYCGGVGRDIYLRRLTGLNISESLTGL